MDGRVSISCAHGDVVSYVPANIRMKIGSQNIQVRAGIAPNLPVPVLLVTDAPELATLLPSQNDGGVMQLVMVVTTHAARKHGEAAQASGEPREGTPQESPDVGPESLESDVVQVMERPDFHWT